MRQNWFLYDGTLLRDLSKKIDGELTKQRIQAAKHIRNKIYAKAKAVKVTGNLAKGVYMKHKKNASFVGIHAPGFQNYLLEFGHFQGKKAREPGVMSKVVIGISKRGHEKTRIKRIGAHDLTETRKFTPAYPIVYPTFAEEAAECERIMSGELNLK
jgi:hypothetical protein